MIRRIFYIYSHLDNSENDALQVNKSNSEHHTILSANCLGDSREFQQSNDLVDPKLDNMIDEKSPPPTNNFSYHFRIVTPPIADTQSVPTNSQDAVFSGFTSTKPIINNNTLKQLPLPTFYQCVDCKKVFKSNNQLSLHQRSPCPKIDKEGFSCPYCESFFLILSNLHNHILQHIFIPNENEVYSSDVNTNLLTKKQLNTTSYKYKCLNCRKLFSDCQHLRLHNRTHTGSRPFKCLHCPKSYPRKYSLTKHIRSRHCISSKPDFQQNELIHPSSDHLKNSDDESAIVSIDPTNTIPIHINRCNSHLPDEILTSTNKGTNQTLNNIPSQHPTALSFHS